MKEYQPLSDKVLIRPIKKEQVEKTASGIITEMAKKVTAEGVVHAVGAGWVATETGVKIPNVLKKGDIVLYGVNAGIDIAIDVKENGEVKKEDMKLMREADVLMKIGHVD